MKQTRPQSVIKQPSGANIPVQPARAVKLKSRFFGLIKLDPDTQLPLATPTKIIDGKPYFEFDQLPGVFFSSDLFVA